MSPPQRAFKLRRFGWRRIHKWIGVGSGVLLVLWIVTGVLIAARGEGRAVLQSAAPVPDYRMARISPSEAISALDERGRASGDIGSLRLELIGSRPTYVIRSEGSGISLVDAMTGVSFEIDGPRALQIARDLYGGTGTPADPVLVDSRGLRYFMGELPAYRVAFDDDYGTEIYVAVRSGTVSWWDGKSWTQRLMMTAHTLGPIGTFFGPRLRRALMVGGGLVTLLVALSGYYLAWRRGGWRFRRRRAS